MNTAIKFTSRSEPFIDEKNQGQLFGHLTLANDKILNFKVDFTLYDDLRKPFTICTIETTNILKLSDAEQLKQVQNEHLIQSDAIEGLIALQKGKKSILSGLMTLG